MTMNKREASGGDDGILSEPPPRLVARGVRVRSNVRAGAPHTIRYTDIVNSKEYTDEWSDAV